MAKCRTIRNFSKKSKISENIGKMWGEEKREILGLNYFGFHVSVVKIPSDMDTVDTFEGLRRTVGVGLEAHPGEAGPVGGRPGDVTKR